MSMRIRFNVMQLKGMVEALKSDAYGLHKDEPCPHLLELWLSPQNYLDLCNSAQVLATMQSGQRQRLKALTIVETTGAEIYVQPHPEVLDDEPVLVASGIY